MPAKRDIRLNIIGSGENVPRAVLAEGRIGDLYVNYLLLPFTAESVMVLSDAGKPVAEREYWLNVNQPGGGDAPRVATRTVSRSTALSAWNKVMNRIPQTAASTARKGEWSGVLTAQGSHFVIGLQRRAATNTTLSVYSEMTRKGTGKKATSTPKWVWEIDIPAGRNWWSPGGKAKSTRRLKKGYATFRAAYNAGFTTVQEMIGERCVIQHTTKRPAKTLKSPAAKEKAAKAAATRATREAKKAKKPAKAVKKMLKRTAPEAVAKTKGTWRRITTGKHEGFVGKVVNIFFRKGVWRLSLKAGKTVHSATLRGSKKATSAQVQKVRRALASRGGKAAAKATAKKAPAKATAAKKTTTKKAPAKKKAAPKKKTAAEKKPAVKKAAKAKAPVCVPKSAADLKGEHVRFKILGGKAVAYGTIKKVEPGNHGDFSKKKNVASGPKLVIGRAGKGDMTIHQYAKDGSSNITRMKSKAEMLKAAKRAEEQAEVKKAASLKKLKNGKKAAPKKAAPKKAAPRKANGKGTKITASAAHKALGRADSALDRMEAGL